MEVLNFRLLLSPSPPTHPPTHPPAWHTHIHTCCTVSAFFSFLVAVLVPDEEVAAATLGLDTPAKIAQACKDKNSPLCSAIMDDVISLAKKAKLAGFEIVSGVTNDVPIDG